MKKTFKDAKIGTEVYVAKKDGIRTYKIQSMRIIDGGYIGIISSGYDSYEGQVDNKGKLQKHPYPNDCSYRDRSQQNNYLNLSDALYEMKQLILQEINKHTCEINKHMGEIKILSETLTKYIR